MANEWSTPFRNHIRPLTTDERQALEASIKNTGRILSPVVLTTKNEILDGHNRYDIGTKLRLPIPKTVIKESKDWTDEQKRWKVEEFAIASRNLSDDELHEIWRSRKLRMQSDRIDGMSDTEIGQKYGISRQRVAQLLDDYKHRNPPCDTYKPDGRRTVPKDKDDDIRERAAAGERQSDIAKDYNISQPRVAQILAHIAEPDDEEIIESENEATQEMVAAMKAVDAAIDSLYEHWESLWIPNRKLHASHFSSCKSQLVDMSKTWKSWKRVLNKEIKNASS